MVEDAELWDAQQTIAHLGITLNNLRQLTHRKRIVWRKRVGRNVFYLADEVRALHIRRTESNRG